MKTRASYVSNSSSSSFVVYGTMIGFDDIAKELDNGRQVICVDHGAGTSGDCADFVFYMTKERLAVLEKYGQILMQKGVDIVCKEFFVPEDRLDEKLLIPELKGGMFFHYDRDYNSPGTNNVDDDDFVEWLKESVESRQ